MKDPQKMSHEELVLTFGTPFPSDTQLFNYALKQAEYEGLLDNSYMFNNPHWQTWQDWERDRRSRRP